MKRKALKISTALLALLASGALQAAPLRCVIEPDRSAEVGSPVIGVVEIIKVERGDFVREGQLLARLRASVERASVGTAETRAKAEADVRAAQASFDYMRQKQARAEDLVKKNFISQQALDQVRAEASVAEQKLAQALEQQQVARHELKLAVAQLGQRLIRAPFDGIIAERYVTVGERVEDRPMFRVAKVHPLRVEVIVPAAMFGTVEPGMLARVTPDLPNAAVLQAKVVLVDKLIDSASNTFRARAELPNADRAVPSGLRCRAELVPAEQARVAPPQSTAGPRPANLKLDTGLSTAGDRKPAPAQRQ